MNDYRAYVENDYNALYHFGIPGMKWGRRRYQNEDGSYKPGAEGRYYHPVGDGKRFLKDKAKTAAKNLAHPTNYGHNNRNKEDNFFDRIRETGRTGKKSNNKVHDYLMNQTRNASERSNDAKDDLKKTAIGVAAGAAGLGLAAVAVKHRGLGRKTTALAVRNGRNYISRIGNRRFTSELAARGRRYARRLAGAKRLGLPGSKRLSLPG